MRRETLMTASASASEVQNNATNWRWSEMRTGDCYDINPLQLTNQLHCVQTICTLDESFLSWPSCAH
ncbi:hypothetical protein FRX31_014424 [Thalictrum thalictroides]|uniref:Uncharacterized protein n=1 Tax=Thalictrum thalictroides TaxID=46969 RepID=A0A7J6WF43_THATH|nr:hypothetical protein FRX31_014424 [Thalictrum thalictroides]